MSVGPYVLAFHHIRLTFIQKDKFSIVTQIMNYIVTF